MTDPLAAMRAKFVRRCEDDLAALKRGGDTPELRAIVHRIAGAAGMFGYAEAGTAALDLDQQWLEGSSPSTEALERLIGKLEAITRTTLEERRAS